jgi:hypothetical protein
MSAFAHAALRLREKILVGGFALQMIYMTMALLENRGVFGFLKIFFSTEPIVAYEKA